MFKKKKEDELAIRRQELPFWRPYSMVEEMEKMCDDFKRMGDFWMPRWKRFGLIPRVFEETREPLVNMVDNGKEYEITAELPGIPKENINIEVNNDTIEIKAEVKKEEEKKEKDYVKMERSYSSFHRVLSFPEEVLANKTKAKFENGILEVIVPKKEQKFEQRHKVKID